MQPKNSKQARFDCMPLSSTSSRPTIPNYALPELLFADDLSLLSNVHDQLQTMLNRLRVYARRHAGSLRR